MRHRSLANVSSRSVVVIGGGVSRDGEQLLGAGARARPTSDRPGRPSSRVVAAELGDAVGVVGAAAVAFERLP